MPNHAVLPETKQVESVFKLDLVCACVVGFAFSANYTNHAPLVPALTQAFGFSLARAGFLTTGIFLTHAAMQIPGGQLADRLSARRVVAIALALVCLGNFAIAFASGYWQLLFWKIFVGLGTGTCFVAGARYISAAYPGTRSHLAQGLYGGSVLLGSGFVIFDLSFQCRRDQVALEFRGRQFTFGEIDARSNRMARLLAKRGLHAGDRLGVYLANCVEMIDLFLACVKQGVIFVPINILYKEREIAHILNDAGPSAVVTAAEQFPAGVPIWRPEELAAEASPLSSERPALTLDGDAAAALIYTSGTTGASKGAILSHNNFAANALNLLACWQISAADRLLLPLPLFHVHGLGNRLHVWLISGCRMRLLERFDHQSAGAEFLDFRPTLFFGVPTIYVRLLDTPPGQAREIGSFMRLFVSGSAPLPAQVLEDFRELFGHVILERYGMTETLMNISNPYAGERRPGTVGLPLPGVSVRLLDPEGNPVPDGETGEIYLRSPNVISGYWNREEATQAAFVNGYFRTGDLAVRSRDGYYTLQGRRSDLIISGGYQADSTSAIFSSGTKAFGRHSARHFPTASSLPSSP